MVSDNVPCAISIRKFPLHSLYSFPACLDASSKFVMVMTCNTSCAPVLVLFVCVAPPTVVVTRSVTSVTSINT